MRGFFTKAGLIVLACVVGLAAIAATLSTLTLFVTYFLGTLSLIFMGLLAWLCWAILFSVMKLLEGSSL